VRVKGERSAVEVNQVVFPGFNAFEKMRLIRPVPFRMRDQNAILQRGGNLSRHVRRFGVRRSKTDTMMPGKVNRQPLDDLAHAPEIKDRPAGDLKDSKWNHSVKVN
jgi:hypothetical protein